jgi:hypothetical protein
MNNENFLSNVKFGLIAVTDNDPQKKKQPILHFCGYSTPPNEADKKLLEMELNTDPEFGLVGRINKDVFIIEATEDIVARFKIPNENNQIRID